jgi:restriction system protein
VEWTTDLRRLNSGEFEWLAGELFRREGWNVIETGRQDGPDGNIDLILTRQGQRTIVQCKRWTSSLVGVDEVRQFSGTLTGQGMPGSAGIFLTLSSFTPQALTEARAMGLTLIDGGGLYQSIEKARRAEPCPACNAPMRLDHSPHGWWFHCLKKGCNGKRDLSDKPARAVELLTLAA